MKRMHGKNKKVIWYKAIRYLRTAILLLSACILLTGCKSKSERYKEALSLYEQGNYQQAENAFKSLKGFEDADALLKKCSKIISLQNEESGKRFVSAWVDSHKNSIIHFGKSFNEMNMRERQDALQNPDFFTDWAIDYAKGQGDRLIFAAAYPYIRNAFEHEPDMAFFGSKLDDYMAEMAAMTELYEKKPRLFRIAEKSNGIYFGYDLPVKQNFTEWIEMNPENAEIIRKIMNEHIEQPKEITLEHIVWNNGLLREYLGQGDDPSSQPQKNTILFVNEDNSKATALSTQKRAVVRAGSALRITDDPDEAEVFVYYTLKRDTKTYIREDGNGSITVREGTSEYRAVDAASRAEIAVVSYQGKAPETVYAQNNDKLDYDPDESHLNEDEDFLAFLKKIEDFCKK